MSYRDIEVLVEKLEAENIPSFEGEVSGARIRIQFAAARTEDLPPIIAPLPGLFRAVHPSRPDRYVPEGTPVRQGAIVGFLEIGAILLPVTALRDCILGRSLVADGTQVGYGQALFAVG